MDTVLVQQTKTISSIGESLSPKAKEALNTWDEYQRVDAMLTRYFAISNAEALSNATELSLLTKQLKDSIRDVRLESHSIKARLNLLYSECKRLEDMNDIPTIKQEEVTFEIRKILDAFSAVNAKFNSVFAIKDLENELDLDPDFQAIINSTTSEDSTTTYKLVETKESINNKPLFSPSTIQNKKRSGPNSKDLKTRKKTQTDGKQFEERIDIKALLRQRDTLRKEKKIKKP